MSEIKSLYGWKKIYPKLYKWAENNGLINDICEKYGWTIPLKPELFNYNPKEYSKEFILEKALEYSDYKEWVKSEYVKISRFFNIAAQCREHMTNCRKPAGFWNDNKNLIKEAKKYKYWDDFRKKSPVAYQSAKRNNLTQICGKHMIGINKEYGWTKKKIIKEAKTYSSIKKWKYTHPYFYEKSQEMGWLNECINIIMGK